MHEFAPHRDRRCRRGSWSLVPVRRRRQTTGVGAPPLTLQDALAQARANSQLFRRHSSRRTWRPKIASRRSAALLPSVNGFSQFIYTRAERHAVRHLGAERRTRTSTPPGSTCTATSSRSAKWAEYRSAAAAEAVARAQGRRRRPRLVATIVHELLHAGRRRAEAGQRAAGPARGAAVSGRSRSSEEAGGEVAHSDVVKAQIQVDAARCATHRRRSWPC